MFETGASVALRASHVMPGVDGPEGVPHEHDYRIDVVVAREELDGQGMVIDLDALRAALADVANQVDGADLDRIRPPEAEAVTVEIFARWAHDQLAPVAGAAGADELTVRVWESDTEFGGYRAVLPPPATTSS